MAYQKKTAQERANEIKKLIEGAENQINKYFESPEEIKKYLDFQAQFYQYSVRNCALIQSQFPGAEAVASFQAFKEKGFSVNQGEHGIKIIGCREQKVYIKDNQMRLISKATKEDLSKIESGEYNTKMQLFFYQTYVFDISQTNAELKDIPALFPNRWLEGKVPDYEKFMSALINTGKEFGATLAEESRELGSAKGVTYSQTKRIELNHRNGELQNVKTMIHELAHAKLHSGEAGTQLEKYEKEFQAEMTAYVVCQHFGLDVSDYSIQYMHNWTVGKDMEQKTELLKQVADTSKYFIKSIEERLDAGLRKKDMEKSREEEMLSAEHQEVEKQQIDRPQYRRHRGR